jgi:subtilase family serine protease
VPETSETNNTLARAIQIGGDLAVSAFTVPTKAGTDTPFVVSDTTANQGGGPVGPTVTQIYLSTNSLIESGDTLIASRAIPGLAAGATSSGSTTATIPLGTAPGLYFLIAKADAGAAVAEALETNNTSVRSIRVGSDLYVSAISLPASGAAGASIVVGDTTANQGGGGSPASVTRFYLSANSTLDAGDVRLDGSRAVPGLPAGGSSAGSTSVTIPASTAAGSFYIIAKADDDSAVGETDETNNTRARNVSIGPDLTISAISVSATSVAAGAGLIVTDSVLNVGAGAAGASTTRFYLSTNTVIDAGDLAIATGRAVPGLGGGASSLGSTSVTIPAGTAAGSYYLIAKADGDGAVAESVETNNTSAAVRIQVTSPL